MNHRITLQTSPGTSLVDITGQVRQLARDSGISEGLCVLTVPHTTAALTVNSYEDPATAVDLAHELGRLVPTRVDFAHTFDTPSDAAAHIKSTLVGAAQVLLIEAGELVLGHAQAVFLFEFDGPRERTMTVKLVAG